MIPQPLLRASTRHASPTGCSAAGTDVSMPPSAARLRRRVLVRTTGRLDAASPNSPLAWHLADCRDPRLPEAHCAEGRRLLAADADPDGHCLIRGVCPRCAGTG